MTGAAAIPTRVAWTRKLEHMEPAAGFGSRIAALNRKLLRPFLAEMLISARDIDKGVEAAIRKLAAVGGADPDALVRFSPRPGGHGEFSHVAGETLDRLQVHRTFFRYCPHCVAEDLRRFDGPMHTRPWLRLPWIVGHFRSCDIHHAPLAVAEPVRRRFEPFDFSEAIADLVLPGLDVARGAAVAGAPSPFQRWVTARLEGRRDPANWLDGVDLYAAAGFAEALGVSILHPPKVATSDLADADWAKAADIGFLALAGGAEGVREALREMNAAQAHTRGYWGLRDTYGYAYGLLQKTLDDPAYEPFRTVVREFALETMPVEPGTDVLGVTAGARRVHTIRSAAIASGAHARTIRRYFERKGLVEDRAAGGVTDHRATVAAEEIERIARELKGALSTTRITDQFGIPRVHLMRIIEIGILKPVTDSAERRYGKHRFTRKTVQDFLDRMFDGAVPVVAPGDNQVLLADARHRANCTLDEIYGLVLGGKLAWKGLLGGRREYGALLLDADELTRLVRDKPARQCLTRLELMDEIPGIAKTTPQFLMDNGHVVATEEFSPDARRMIPVITRESAEAFRARYVTLGELSAARGWHHKQVTSKLNRKGVGVAFDVEEAGCFIFDRRQAEEALKGADR